METEHYNENEPDYFMSPKQISQNKLCETVKSRRNVILNPVHDYDIRTNLKKHKLKVKLLQRKTGKKYKIVQEIVHDRNGFPYSYTQIVEV